MQDCSNSFVNALELLQSCTRLSIQILQLTFALPIPDCGYQWYVPTLRVAIGGHNRDWYKYSIPSSNHNNSLSIFLILFYCGCFKHATNPLKIEAKNRLVTKQIIAGNDYDDDDNEEEEEEKEGGMGRRKWWKKNSTTMRMRTFNLETHVIAIYSAMTF